LVGRRSSSWWFVCYRWSRRLEEGGIVVAYGVYLLQGGFRGSELSAEVADERGVGKALRCAEEEPGLHF